jgi:DNA ligase D-like protein (predicted 3'-phosphoesterase)
MSKPRKDSLAAYRKKRDFHRTSEPAPRKKKSGKQPIFVIQKHDARNLHYDFRIEVDGVLKSWAVPKGLSTDPKAKRLAIPTEDHPLDYARFEGVIPKGEYGGGTVMIWDKGTYRNVSKKDDKEVPIERALQNGHVAVWLTGKKLSGGYALHRTGHGERERWLMVKMKDKEADARRKPLRTERKSAVSGRTMKQIVKKGK